MIIKISRKQWEKIGKEKNWLIDRATKEIEKAKESESNGLSRIYTERLSNLISISGEIDTLVRGLKGSHEDQLADELLKFKSQIEDRMGIIRDFLGRNS